MINIMEKENPASLVLEDTSNSRRAHNINDEKATAAHNEIHKVDNASKAFEKILQAVGDFHKHQWKLTLLVGLGGLFNSLHNKAAVFLAASPEHWCDIPYLSENNVTIERKLLNITAPWVRGKYGDMEPSKCKYHDLNYTALKNVDDSYLNISNWELDVSSLSTEVEDKFCESWVYSKDIYESTVVTEWDLVCKNRWMMSSTQATFMFGILIGAVVFSALSDKIGRQPTSVMCCCLFFISSVSVAFSTSFVMFLILRFIVAATSQGVFLANYVLLIETVSLKGRSIMGNSPHTFFCLGTMLLSVCGYYIQDWRNLQLVISFPVVALLVSFWALPESPRWLLMHGREKEGVKLLKSIAKCNGKPFLSEDQLQPLLGIISQEVKEHNKKRATVLQKIKSIWTDIVTLVRTPNMRRRNTITFYCWFVTSMSYYGLTFSGSNINASVHVTVGLTGVMSLVLEFLTVYLLTRFGRRKTICCWYFIGGLSCLCIMFLPKDLVWLNLLLTLIGQASSSCAFVIVYLLSAELVPTDVRNISIGIASMFGRIGSGIAPFIVDLLGDIYYAIPSTIFSVLVIIAGLLSLLLPETRDKRLPESIEEIEAMPR